MSAVAVVLIVTSAIMHASWNFVSKRGDPSPAFFFISAVSAALIMSPFLYSYRSAVSFFPPVVWGLLLATGVAQAVYFFGLAGAYRKGDMSLAYPLARAIPVLLVALITLKVGGYGKISAGGLAGMGLIVIGCLILPLRRFRSIRPRDYFDVVYLMALIAATGTVGYTLLDDQALRTLRDTPDIQLSNSEVTLLFISLQTISTAVMLGLGTVFVREQRRHLGELLQARSLFISAALTGVVIMAAYGLVLAAMAFVSNVSYVAAFRQLSIPMGALLGLSVQREPRYLPKVVGIGVISVGLILVGIG